MSGATSPKESDTRTTLILTRSDVAELLTMRECIEAVESAFRAHAEGRAVGPEVASVHVDGGGFHIKAAGLTLSRPYFAAKTNGNFFHNDRLQLPRIQGTVVLCDASNGIPLAVLDSIEITVLRTAAATAVACRHLAGRDSSVLAIIGCGLQGHATFRAVVECLPIQQVFLFDPNPVAVQSLMDVVRSSGLRAHAAAGVSDAMREAHLCVTATPSTVPIVGLPDLHPGLFIAAVGADSDTKQELDPAIVRGSRVIVDSREQAAVIGEVHHAIDEGHSANDLIAGTLGDVIAGRVQGRTSEEEIVVFDSTGTALQDVAAAAIVYERALSRGRGVPIRFAS